MKKFIALLLFFFVLIPLFSFACKIFVSVDGVQKTKYKIGEVVIVKIRVEKEHRRCSVDIKDTKINVTGIQIIGATDWVQVDNSTWDRKLKVKILSSVKNKKAIITVVRECDREGGKGDLVLQTE